MVPISFLLCLKFGFENDPSVTLMELCSATIGLIICLFTAMLRFFNSEDIFLNLLSELIRFP